MNISVSEINSFLTCRRQWDLTSGNRQSLKHKVTPKLYFVIGSAVHEALDAGARGDDPFTAFETYVEAEKANRLAVFELGGYPVWDSQMEEFESSVDLARCLVRQYYDHYSIENPLVSDGLKYVATEVPFSIPLREGLNFVGTWDGILTDIETETQFYLIENKTFGRRPNLELFATSNQIRGYNWAFRELTGVTPSGTLYNGIAKKLIQKPKMLKSGALSVDRSASITLDTFMEAIQQGGYDPLKYLDYINFLSERERHGDDDRFFIREMLHTTNTELDNWRREVLWKVMQEMTFPDFGADDIEVFPNYTACEHCNVRDICGAMDRGDDVDLVVSTRYELGKSPSMRAVDGVTPSVVTSTSDLLEILNYEH